MSPFDSVPRTPQGLRMLLGAFRGGNPLERIVGKPPTESRRHAVGHEKGLGVFRPSGGANAVAGCWPTPEEHIPAGSDRVRVGLFSPAIVELQYGTEGRF